MISLSLILIIVATAFAAVALIQSKGGGLISWAVLCLAIVHLLAYLPVVIR